MSDSVETVTELAADPETVCVMPLTNVTAPFSETATIFPTLLRIETAETALAATVQARMMGRNVVATLEAVADIVLPTDLMTVTAPLAVNDRVNDIAFRGVTAPDEATATIFPIERNIVTAPLPVAATNFPADLTTVAAPCAVADIV